MAVVSMIFCKLHNPYSGQLVNLTVPPLQIQVESDVQVSTMTLQQRSTRLALRQERIFSWEAVRPG